MITFDVTISAYQTEEEFNTFTVKISFRRATEGSLPEHLIEEGRIVLGYLWPNLYYRISEDLIVHTPSRGSSVTGVTTSGTTTPVNPPSPPEELHKVPIPPDPLPELPGFPGIITFNQRVAEVWRRVEAHNREVRELSSSTQPPLPVFSALAQQHLATLLACIQSGENLDEPAFKEGNITFRQLQRINQSTNPNLYSEASLLEDTDYQPPRYQDDQSVAEEEDEEVHQEEVQEEEVQEEEHWLPIPEPLGIHLRIPCSEHNSPDSYSGRLRELLDEPLGTLIETTFYLPESLESD